MLPCGEAVLIGQSEQASAVPPASLYFPAAHMSHNTPFDVAVDPALQMHDVLMELPVGEFVFVGQPVHARAVPGADLKVPATHALHATPLTVAINPALQIHDEIVALAVGESVFNGQS